MQGIPAEDAEIMAPIVGWLARRFRGVRERDDLLSLAWLGLQEARSRGDDTRHARTRIKYAVLDAIRRERPLPRYLYARARRVERAEDRLRARLHRAPTAGELALELGVDRDAVFRWRELRLEGREIQIDQTLPTERERYDDIGQVMAQIDSIAAPADDPDLRLDVERALASLRPRERILIERSVMGDERLVDAARAAGYSIHRAVVAGKCYEGCSAAGAARARVLGTLAARLA